jgi:hypothetical protein
LGGARVLDHLLDKHDIVETRVGDVGAVDFRVADPFEKKYESVDWPLRE